MQRLAADSCETAILGLLQLADVMGQLLEYTRKRAEGLSTLAETLADAVDHDTPLLQQARCNSDGSAPWPGSTSARVAAPWPKIP